MGFFQQFLHAGLDVPFGIDAEGLRHLPRVDLGLRRVVDGLRRRRIVGRARLVGDAFK